MLLGLLTCKEALRCLDDYIDRELSREEIERVERHLRICHACSRKFATEASFVQQLRGTLDHLAVPPQLMSRISIVLAQSNDPESPTDS